MPFEGSPFSILEQSDAQVVASYDHRGDHIFVGNSKGRILVVTGDEKMTNVTQFRVTQQVSSTTAIKSIEFSRRGCSFLVNTADRIIRTYRTKQVLDNKTGK